MPNKPNNEGSLDKCQECRKVENNVEGPQPMRNKKPSERTPNSADQFKHAHQVMYESIRKSSTDQVEVVRRHNATYPVLKEQLDNRRTTAEVRAVNDCSRMDFDGVYRDCLELNRNLKKLTLILKHCASSRKGGDIININHKDNKSKSNRRLGKCKKYRSINHRFNCSNPSINKSLKSSKNFNPHSSLRTRNLKESLDCVKLQIIRKNDNSGDNEKSYRATMSQRSEGNTVLDENGSESDVRSFEDTIATEPSVSSYHSYLSMDHEPML